MKTEPSAATLAWLLDPLSPGVRYLALRDLVGLHEGNPELETARAAAHQSGPIAAILKKMQPEGYWSKPGPGYNPKYFSTVWSLILLGQLGARVEMDERIQRACTYLLEANLTPEGHFSVNGTSSGTIDCLQGNLCAALVALGCDDPRLEGAYEWMARTVTGEGIAPAGQHAAPMRYYQYKCGPNFACGVNEKMPCAWGAVKVGLALGALPSARRTPLVERAIQQSLEFFFSTDPATANYPAKNGIPSRSWWKFGFPVFYVTDILQLVEALIALGAGNDPRLAGALDLVWNKQDAEGRWALEYDYAGKTWANFGPIHQANPWVTLRALRIFKSISALP
jgi:hypothetical protein